MAFNIKNEQTVAALRELAERRGETMTEVVDTAVRELLDRSLATRSKFEATMQIVADAQDLLTPEWKRMTMADHDAELYDEDGLPR